MFHGKRADRIKGSCWLNTLLVIVLLIKTKKIERKRNVRTYIAELIKTSEQFK